MRPHSIAKVDKWEGGERGARLRGQKFSKSHPKGEPGGMSNTVPIGEEEVGVQGLKSKAFQGLRGTK